MCSKVSVAFLGGFISLLFNINYCLSLSFTTYSHFSDSVIIEGKVFDAETKSPIKAMLSFERIPGRDDIGVFYSDSLTGDYRFVFKDSSRYKLTIQAEAYVTAFKWVDIPFEEDSTFYKEIYLIPLKVGQIIVMDRISFKKGNDKLLPESYGELDNVFKMLNENPNMEIQLEGHTDNAGSSEANLKLSERRVNAVKDYLVEKGVKKNRIEVKAFGGAKPVASNSTEEGRIRNRRVEIRILRN
ncbi:MAG TPA: OmpA family protein [Cytophagales bacterium]|nr:OmpA family protein [Cytophagales bacterium]